MKQLADKLQCDHTSALENSPTFLYSWSIPWLLPGSCKVTWRLQVLQKW